MPSFYWGHVPTPDFVQYPHRRVYYDLLFSLPYYSAGLLLTAIGCGATPLILPLPLLIVTPLLSAACFTLALLLLFAIVV